MYLDTIPQVATNAAVSVIGDSIMNMYLQHVRNSVALSRNFSVMLGSRPAVRGMVITATSTWSWVLPGECPVSGHLRISEIFLNIWRFIPLLQHVMSLRISLAF